LQASLWSPQRYEQLLTSFVELETEEPAVPVLAALDQDLIAQQYVAHRRTALLAERLLISLLGHEVASVREFAAIRLNVFYDEHDWQVRC
jgi:hypothetical protein